MKSVATSRRSFIRRISTVAAGALCKGRPLSAAEPIGNRSVASSMDRAAKCCLAWLNPEQNLLPTGGYEIAHDTGRWWDAMLRYEAVTGVRIPEQTETAMMRNLRLLTDNPAALLMNTAKLPGPPAKLRVNPHNLRETLMAYTALVRHRKSDWAKRQGLKLIETLSAVLEPDGQMDYAKLATTAGGQLTTDPLVTQRAPANAWFNATGTSGRAIESLVLFHEATGEARAMELAQRLAKVHFRQVLDPSGQVRAELRDSSHVGHTHSYCGTLRGLLLYGLASGEKEYVDAVASTYRHGLWGVSISHSGWTPHDQGKIRFPNQDGDPLGEHASCGDVAQMALWLALRAGQTDLLDDVERLVRARLLPSQIIDPQQPRRDGAWGVYPHPFGYGAILDVFAAVLHSMTDFHEHGVTRAANNIVTVHLHFDRETPDLKVSSARGENATLTVTLKQRCALRLRVPSWAARETVRLNIGGAPQLLHWEGNYLTVAADDAAPRAAITLEYDLPKRQTTEEMPVSHKKFRLSWKGDEVISCDPKVPIYAAG